MLLPASQKQEFLVIYFCFDLNLPSPFTMVGFRGGSFTLEFRGSLRINVGVRGWAPVVCAWSEQNVETKNFEDFFSSSNTLCGFPLPSLWGLACLLVHTESQDKEDAPHSAQAPCKFNDWMAFFID